MTNLRVSEIFFVASALLLSLALTASTWLFLNDEDRFGPEGVGNSFSISAIPDQVSVDDVTTVIDDVAQRLGVNVYKTWPSARDGMRVTDYYLFEGDPSTVIGDTATGSFPSFGGVYVGTLSPSSTLTAAQLYGSYAVYGSESQTTQFATALGELGLDVGTTSVPSALIRWPLEVVGSPLAAAIMVSWLGLLLASLSLVVIRMTIASTRLSSGMSESRVLIRDAAAIGIPGLIAGALPTTIIVAHARLFSDGYRTSTALSMLVPQLLIVAAAPLIALVLHRASTRRFSVGRVISGARPTRLLISVAVIALLVSGLSATASSVGVITRSEDYRAERSLDSYWQERGDLSLISLSYAATTADTASLQKSLADVYRNSELSGEVLLSQGDALSSSDVLGSDGRTRSAVANSAFISTLDVLSETQSRAIDDHVSTSGGVAVLVPSEFSDQTSEIVAQTLEWLDFEATLDPSGDVPNADVMVIDDVDAGIIPRFDTALAGVGEMYLTDPILVVTDATSGLLPDDFYAAAGAYTDPAALQSTLEASGLATYVTNLERAADIAALEEADDAADLWTAVVGLVLMSVVLVAGWVIMCSVYLVRQRARIFLMWSTGSSFAAIHGVFLLAACAGALLPSLGYLIPSTITLPDKVLVFAALTVFAGGAVSTALGLLGRQHHRSALLDS